MLLWAYVDPTHGKPWIAASLQVAHMSRRGTYWAKMLHKWARDFISTRMYPENLYDTWHKTLITNKDFKQELNTYLQSVEPSGQYVNGYEHKDVKDYRQNVFLPEMAKYEHRIRAYDNEGNELPRRWPHDMDDGLRPYEDIHVLWYHDESTFYANDRCKVGWVHSTAKAVPRAKGEGPSIMAADFVSADYGWLRSPDCTESARVLFKAGVERQGYFTNSDVLAHAHKAMDILDKHHPHEKHVLIFEKTQQLTENVLMMPFQLEKCQKAHPGVWIQIKLVKEWAPMANRSFADGREQAFYFPEGHPQAGIFKGMATILEECGYDISGKNSECEGFRCKPGATDCCCRIQ
ncbi:hypothetical protein CVT24_006615 [Panaeolus cyanescens]|uniref:Uncharacterized protein n=1 Tax=Panaeolus cyanescens TaxID=181874 RepID=A0A409YSB6_9AGAR|nr:hypothetical protein CVT24_006615 [Panaeolus cyanescens]